MLGSSFRVCALRVARQQRLVVGRSPVILHRSFASDDHNKHPDQPRNPSIFEKMLGVGNTDNLIATNRDRKLKKGDIPEFLPEDVKKDLDTLGVDNITEDLHELEESNLSGYSDYGLVPPEGSGTFAEPILVPSRRESRQVGYVDPLSHSTYWFNIYNDDNTYYIKDLGLFFKMIHIPDDEMKSDAHH